MLRLSVACLLAVAAPAWSQDSKVDWKAKLEGEYTVVSGEEGGKPVPAEKIKGSLTAFKGDKILGTDKDKKEFFSCTYSIEGMGKIAKISMTTTDPNTKKEITVKGIVTVDGDTVKLCYALPGGEEPKEFKTKEKQNCFTLKKSGK